MRRFDSTRMVAAIAVLGLAACASQRTRVESPETTEPTVVSGNEVPSGTQLVVGLDQPISKETKPGQTFTARVSEPVVDPAGAPIITSGSVLMGQVAEVKQGKGDKPAEVDLVVNQLVVGKSTVPVDARIVATDVSGGNKKIKGQHVAIGAAGGGILGGIIGGWQGVLIGGLAGAATGTAISLGLAGSEAKLPAGTTLVVELQRPISVAALRQQ